MAVEGAALATSPTMVQTLLVPTFDRRDTYLILS